MRNVFYLALLFLWHDASGQDFDTIPIYFNVDSDRPIINKSSQNTQFKRSGEGHSTVIRLEAHCDTTGSEEYNDALAQRRIRAVKQQLIADNWKIDAVEKIYSERIAGVDSEYVHDIYRRVDIIVKITPPTDAELLTMKLNAFLEDTVAEKSIDLKILFLGGTTTLMRESIPEAKALKDFLRENTTIKIEIHGHVCCGDNFPLSYNRAKMITEFLIAQGIDLNRMTFEGHSNKKPKVYPEVTDEDRKQNRRVAIVFKKK